ncbi:V-type ATP synthase subunit C [subsurface metagenome]
MIFQSASRYSFINTRIRGLKAKLLSAADYEKLLDAEDIEELTRLLVESDYQILFQEVGTHLNMLDTKLNQSFIQEVKSLLNYLPKGSQQFVQCYLRRYFLDGLKTILRTFGTGIPPQEVQTLLLGTEEEIRTLQDLIMADSLSLMVERLTNYYLKNILREQVDLAESLKTSVPLELAIDRWFYTGLWKDSEDALRGTDRELAQQFVGNQIDLLNIQALLRIKRQFPAFDERMIRNLLIPMNYRLRDVLNRCLTAASPTEIFNYLLDTPYRDFARLSREVFEETGSLGDLEMRAKGHLHYIAFRMLLGQPFNIGAFLAFLIIKGTEIQNVRAIAVGIASNVDKARIRQYILVP